MPRSCCSQCSRCACGGGGSGGDGGGDGGDEDGACIMSRDQYLDITKTKGVLRNSH